MEEIIDFDVFNCKFDKNRPHLLNEPKLLPCSNHACLKCIQTSLAKNNYLHIKCNFLNCKQRHVIGNFKNLRTDETAINLFKSNFNGICNEIHRKLKIYIEIVQEKSISRTVELERRADMSIDDIYLQIESLKASLDILNGNLCNTMDFVKANYTLSKKKFQCKLMNASITDPQIIEFSQILRKKFRRIRKLDIFSFTDLKSLKSHYKTFRYSLDDPNGKQFTIRGLEAYMVKMSKRHDVTAVSFVQNTNLPETTSIVGKIINPTGLYYIELERKEPTSVLINDCRSIKGFCNLDDKRLLLTDPKTNLLLLMDENFNELKRLRTIDKVKLEYPNGMCTDLLEYVYIADHDNNRIVITDLNLEKVIKIIGKQGRRVCEFDCPTEICYFANFIYILDRGNKRVQIFTRNGIFYKIFPLYYEVPSATKDGKAKKVDLTIPLCLNVMRSFIGVLNVGRIYLYTHGNELVQIIEPNNLKCFCFINDKIYAYNNESNLICYSRNYERNGLCKDVFVDTFSIRFSNLRTIQASCMTMFREKLIVSIDLEKRIVVI